jgi:TRAP-type C4-dicarboxylate transport system permease small subunit
MTKPTQCVLHPERPGQPPGRSGFSWLFFDRFEEIVGGAAFVAMTAMVFVNVVCRYLFNSPIPGTDELATLAFTWATFLGASLGIRRQLHLGIEFVTRVFPDRVQAFCGLMVSALIGAFAVLLLIYSGQIMRTAHLKLTPVLQWPYTIVYLAVPVGTLLMLLRLVPIIRAQVLRLAGRGGGVGSAEVVPL